MTKKATIKLQKLLQALKTYNSVLFTYLYFIKAFLYLFKTGCETFTANKAK